MAIVRVTAIARTLTYFAFIFDQLFNKRTSDTRSMAKSTFNKLPGIFDELFFSLLFVLRFSFLFIGEKHRREIYVCIQLSLSPPSTNSRAIWMCLWMQRKRVSLVAKRKKSQHSWRKTFFFQYICFLNALKCEAERRNWKTTKFEGRTVSRENVFFTFLWAGKYDQRKEIFSLVAWAFLSWNGRCATSIVELRGRYTEKSFEGDDFFVCLFVHFQFKIRIQRKIIVVHR